MISPDNNFLILSIIIAAAAFGIISEKKKWFGKVSGILVCMISMSILSMTGIIPVASGSEMNVGVYKMVYTYFIPISIPLLLFSSNISKIIKESGKLLIAYIMGAIGVVIGCFIAYKLIDLGDQSANTAGVIASTLIGGSVNFVAAGEALSFSTNPLFSATVAIDNFISNIYILILFTIPSIGLLKRFFAKPKLENTKIDIKEEKTIEEKISLESISLVIFIACSIAALGNFIAPLLQKLFNTEINLSILLITSIALIAANVFPKQLQKLEHTAFTIGIWMMYVFLAVIGAATNLQDMIHVGPSVFLFYAFIMTFHLAFVILSAKLLKLDVYEVIISSAANIMGPSVAAPMAASLGQKKLITPAILVGILGYVIGTFVGVSIAMVLS